jgi:acetolactate synthase regulatory subunit
MRDLPKTSTVLVALRDGPHGLARLLALCHRRGWTPVSLRSVSDGVRTEVTMRLEVQPDRRGTDEQLRAQIARLVDVEHVAVDSADGLPDAVAFAAVRHRAPWASAHAA